MKAGTRFSLTFATCVLCAAAILGCSRSDTLPADVTGALEQAYTRHDLEATVGLFADDAQILPQHGPAIRGREEIEAYFRDSITPKTKVNPTAISRYKRPMIKPLTVACARRTLQFTWQSSCVNCSRKPCNWHG